MADSEKLRAIGAALEQQEKKLADLASQEDPSGGADHAAAHHDALVETMKAVRTLVEVLGEMGL